MTKLFCIVYTRLHLSIKTACSSYFSVGYRPRYCDASINAVRLFSANDAILFEFFIFLGYGKTFSSHTDPKIRQKLPEYNVFGPISVSGCNSIRKSMVKERKLRHSSHETSPQRRKRVRTSA